MEKVEAVGRTGKVDPAALVVGDTEGGGVVAIASAVGAVVSDEDPSNRFDLPALELDLKDTNNQV